MMADPVLIIARWQTRGSRYWIELHEVEGGFSYLSDNGCGNLGGITREAAITELERCVAEHKAIDGINMRRVA